MVLCLASRPRQQGCQGPPGPTESHWIPPGPTESHRGPAGATGSHLVPPASSPQSLVQLSPRPPWRPQPGGFVDVTTTHGRREGVQMPTWGTPCSPQLPTPAGLARDQPMLWAPHGSGLRLGPAPRGEQSLTRGTLRP